MTEKENNKCDHISPSLPGISWNLNTFAEKLLPQGGLALVCLHCNEVFVLPPAVVDFLRHDSEQMKPFRVNKFDILNNFFSKGDSAYPDEWKGSTEELESLLYKMKGK